MRLDLYLSENGFCDSRSKAQTVIQSGRVSVNDSVITKASFDVKNNDIVSVAESNQTEFVGRGGNKLEHTFSVFDYSAQNKICLDIGASTGGFTQCLLMHGAKCVYAVDSGRDQLAKTLLTDERVVSIEGFNARSLTSETLDGNLMDLVVMDVSFISQRLLYPAILRVAKKGADVITLIKPQFEVGKQYIGKKGIVKDVKIKKRIIQEIIESATEIGFEYVAHTESPITGGDGNQEFLLHLKVKS
ncbi:MAG: TlyA family RNA methyltransferase [Clostridia bacterium]|nr:TlyA family RNA methyltransferase [Clostridia bacterium]